MPASIASPPRENKWVVTVAVTVGTLMGAIDSSIVNVALPHMRGTLGASIQEITWVSTGYIVAMVIVMPLVAWLGTLFGRKRVYMACLGIFLVGSFCCGAARTLTALVVFRVMQGLGAGALQPTEQAILRETFPIEEQGMAMGLYGLAVMIGPAIGPTLGGYIVDNFEWPWIFYINIPIGIVGLLMVQRFVHDPEHARAHAVPAKVDLWGIAFLVSGLACLQTLLEKGSEDDWFQSGFICFLALAAASLLAAFVTQELTTEHPAVDLRILKNLSFASGTFVGAILGAALFGSIFLLPLFMQELLGYDATQSGLTLMPRSLAMVAMMPIAGALYNRMGHYVQIPLGLVLVAVATFLMSTFTLDSGQWQLLVPQILQGVGFSLMFVALSTTTLSTIERSRMTNATGLYNLVRQLGGSFGVAAFATLLEDHREIARNGIIAHLSPTRPAVRERLSLMASALGSRLGIHGAAARRLGVGALARDVYRQSAAMGYEQVFFEVALLIVICIPLVFLIRKGRGAVESAALE
ncbi:MAG: DHA2 family efflux MFS transporter permease subunit [Deltaproteobacteria bacterium]